jgi:hypothetical protein
MAQGGGKAAGRTSEKYQWKKTDKLLLNKVVLSRASGVGEPWTALEGAREDPTPTHPPPTRTERMTTSSTTTMRALRRTA